MKCNYLTIEREYGSGGTKIARRLAQECSVACYGSEILEAVSKKYDIPVKQIQDYEESVSSSFLYSLFAIGRMQSGDNDLLTKEGHIFVAEQAIIRNLCANGPAVFLGHCAAQALKDCKGVVNVFIRCSDQEEKKKRIITDYGINEAQVEATIKRFDKKRANYYYANTTKRWNDPSNYDIMLDSAKLGVEGCVSLLKGLFTAG